jgi:hypothetical protein
VGNAGGGGVGVMRESNGATATPRGRGREGCGGVGGAGKRSGTPPALRGAKGTGSILLVAAYLVKSWKFDFTRRPGCFRLVAKSRNPTKTHQAARPEGGEREREGKRRRGLCLVSLSISGKGGGAAAAASASAEATVNWDGGGRRGRGGGGAGGGGGEGRREAAVVARAAEQAGGAALGAGLRGAVDDAALALPPRRAAQGGGGAHQHVRGARAHAAGPVRRLRQPRPRPRHPRRHLPLREAARARPGARCLPRRLLLVSKHASLPVVLVSAPRQQLIACLPLTGNPTCLFHCHKSNDHVAVLALPLLMLLPLHLITVRA